MQWKGVRQWCLTPNSFVVYMIEGLLTWPVNVKFSLRRVLSMSHFPLSNMTIMSASRPHVSALSSAQDEKASGSICLITLDPHALCLASTHGPTVNELLNVPWLKPFWPKAASFGHD
jgi:hypothetical protein